MHTSTPGPRDWLLTQRTASSESQHYYAVTLAPDAALRRVHFLLEFNRRAKAVQVSLQRLRAFMERLGIRTGDGITYSAISITIITAMIHARMSRQPTLHIKAMAEIIKVVAHMSALDLADPFIRI